MASSSFNPRPLSWHALPVEIKFCILDELDIVDIRSLSTVDRKSYALCVPAMWRHVDLKSGESLFSYLLNVPSSYQTFVRKLTICTKSLCGAKLGGGRDKLTPAVLSNALSVLLSRCYRVQQLVLNLGDTLCDTVVPSFKSLSSLRVLTIRYCGDEQNQPLSERLVVSIAATVPTLVELSLSCITRSAMHAPELIGARPFVPVVTGDESLPPHSLLGTELSLPSLLRLPSLQKLSIRDTHLGDPRWSTTPVCCSLQVLDLGTCYHESHDFNRICTERIVGNVGHTVDEFSLNTAISAESLQTPTVQNTPFSRLRKVHLTPLFPVENVVDTLSALSGSPIERLAVRCHEDDVIDMCSALEDFLTIRAKRTQDTFFERLVEITVDAVADLNEYVDLDGSPNSVVAVPSEHADAVRHLQGYCNDLHLAHSVSGNHACNTTGERSSVPPVAQ